MSWPELLPPSLVILAGLIGILLLSVTTKDVQNPPRSKFGIVLDAGPSRTALFIYRWPASKENDTGVVSDYSSCAVPGPGIHHYAGSPEQAGSSLKPCLSQAMKEIPTQQHGQTPVYLGATDSTRLSPAVSDALLAAVSSALKLFPFDFRGAEILSLPQQAVFGWVTVNYLLENFIKDHGYVRTVSHPCWPLSYSRDVPFGSVHAGPCIANNIPLRAVTSEDVFHVTGSSNSSACRKLMGSLFNSSLFCNFSQCSPNGVFQPNRARFQVISEALDLVKKMTPAPDLGQAVDSLCGMSLEELSKMSQASPDRLADHCSVSTFLYHLRARGFLFDWDSSGQTTFQEVGNTSAGWTLGYMLNLTNAIPEEKPSSLKGIEYGVWPLLFILFVLLLTGSFTRIAYRVMAKDDGQDGILEGE
ncbi:ectonucleoside triphosphate diphosphohydrolase 2-like isoform X4 [Pelodiscus sinensis]|uniref:ectonucleoside triphosphate diphosphohydrolase 2-like isoform X4 n=1 Tax=Pelodiscus sinensis TaxID=13735 RepID=UPI003F6BB494